MTDRPISAHSYRLRWGVGWDPPTGTRDTADLQFYGGAIVDLPYLEALEALAEAAAAWRDAQEAAACWGRTPVRDLIAACGGVTAFCEEGDRVCQAPQDAATRFWALLAALPERGG